jgi:hypothetical protein
MTPEIIGGIIRALLAAFGGTLIASGLVTEADITAISGGIITFVTVAWSIYSKKKAVK